MYDKCMTKQNENRVVDIYNAVSVRSEADSNRCTRFCRPLPSHSAIRPDIVSPRPPPPIRITFRTAIGASGVQIYEHFQNLQNFCATLRYFPKIFTFTLL